MAANGMLLTLTALDWDPPLKPEAMRRPLTNTKVRVPFRPRKEMVD